MFETARGFIDAIDPLHSTCLAVIRISPHVPGARIWNEIPQLRGFRQMKGFARSASATLRAQTHARRRLDSESMMFDTGSKSGPSGLPSAAPPHPPAFRLERTYLSCIPRALCPHRGHRKRAHSSDSRRVERDNLVQQGGQSCLFYQARLLLLEVPSVPSPTTTPRSLIS